MLDAALVGVECLNVRCVSARAPVFRCFAVVELRHVAQRRTGKVLAPPVVKQWLRTVISNSSPLNCSFQSMWAVMGASTRGFIPRSRTLYLSIHWQRIEESH